MKLKIEYYNIPSVQEWFKDLLAKQKGKEEESKIRLDEEFEFDFDSFDLGQG